MARRGLALLAVTAAVLLLAAVLAVTFVGFSSTPRHSGGPPATALSRPRHSPAVAGAGGGAAAAPSVSAAQEPWQLEAPVGDEIVLPDVAPGAAAPAARAGLLEVFGGATTGGQLAEGVFTLDVSTGALVHVGNLGEPLADAAGAVIDGRGLVLGGRSPAPQSVVQGLVATSAPSPGIAGSVVAGSLPAPRSGAVAVTVGTVTYVVGGTDGTAAQPQVLATEDGRTFSVAATLRVPVAFPAVAAVGTSLYVFGGSARSGADAGRPVTTIQVVDTASHTVTLAGTLPEALSGAAAVTLGGQVFVIGGDTAAPGAPTSPAAPTPTGAASGSTGTPSATVWAFDPATTSLRRAGQLAVPVSHAGVAVVGQTAWVVGGESAGAPTAVVQSVTYQAPASPAAGTQSG
jgi:hypothetical protein